ncbi:MAG: hypothetical protein JRI25_06715 [Deltaproteobacteria bacterium]|nr:hypothetical protein [Deltaproteobacteria bacterium]
MRILHLLPLLALALGCDGNGDTDDTDDTGEEDLPPIGDLSCYTPGDAWLTQTVDVTLQLDEQRTELVHDFENETPVYEATVEVWLDDVVDDSPDHTQHVDDNGYVTLSLPSCAPMAYRTSTPVELLETKDTYEAHQIYEPVATGEEAPFQSVSRTTYLVIPNLMGISVDPEASIIAGTLYDCNGDPVERGEVRVVDGSGEEPDGAIVKYFVQNFPNRDQPYTSADGLWVAINVPVGTWTVEGHVSDGAGGRDVIGATVLQTYADSINISNIHTGFGEGIRYPDACLLSE